MPATPTGQPHSSTVTVGDVEGGIKNAIIAGGSVYVNQLLYGDDKRARSKLTARIREDWIDGFLADSLGDGDFIPLSLDSRPDLLAPSRPLLSVSDDFTEPDLLATFRSEIPRSLLILGEPGSGKTTLTLELARNLLSGESPTGTGTLPVVLNLSSYRLQTRSNYREENGIAPAALKLTHWLASEISKNYRVPEHFAGLWLRRGDLTLILDELDGVAAAYREDLVTAINSFQEKTLCNLIITSRLDSYLGLKRRLDVERTVCIQPMSIEQTTAFLASRGVPTSEFMAGLMEDPDLAELAQAPLMLSVLVTTFSDSGRFEVAHGSVDEKRRMLFAAYTRVMFSRKPLPSGRPVCDEDLISSAQHSCVFVKRV